MTARKKILSPANAARRAARAENPIPDRLACAAWARRNRDKVTARVRRWQLANPARYKAQQRRAKAAQRARRAAEGQFILPLSGPSQVATTARQSAV